MYLVHSAKHLSRVGDSFHSPSEDVQRQLQPLQDLTALTVQTQALQCLQKHTNTHVLLLSLVVLLRLFSNHLSYLLHLQGLPAPAQLQLDVFLSQVAGVLLRLQPLLQGVLITAEGEGYLRKSCLRARKTSFFHSSF